MSRRKDIYYYLFGVSLVLLQFIGYIFTPLLLLAALLLFSHEEFIRGLRQVPFYALFVFLSITIGLWLMPQHHSSFVSLAKWGQFYFFSVVLLGIRQKEDMLHVIKYFVYLLFFADFLANMLQVCGVSLPWVYLTVRPGEIIPRFQGIMGNSLFSGSISFLALCFILGEQLNKKFYWYIIILVMAVNIFLAGSQRYYISLLAVALLIFFKGYRHRGWIVAGYPLIILAVVFLTKATMYVSTSNFHRYRLWQHAIRRIYDAPLFGNGFIFQEVNDHTLFSVRGLASANVTESTILLFGLCFGIPLMLLFLFVIFKTLFRFSYYHNYAAELGLFLGLSLDLFWGGSLDNCMSLTIFLLSLYLINTQRYRTPKNTLSP